MIYPSQQPQDRLNYIGDLHPVVDHLCEAYRIGTPKDFFVIAVGYEDCNIVIETEKGKYVAKIFSKQRSQEDIGRYVGIIEKAVEAGVHHPALIKMWDNTSMFTDKHANSISMILMNFVDGKTFLEAGDVPSTDDLKKVIAQAVSINMMDYHPAYVSDSWAVPNMTAMFERVKQYIDKEGTALVEKAMALYAQIPVADLPHCFVHGDFTKANVMKGNDGTMYILDFSVANWYPRIQELAVIAANLLYKEDDTMSLREKTDMIAAEYSAALPLTDTEKQHLYAYALAAVAMEFMGAHQEKFIKGNGTEETEYWFHLGFNGLKRELGEAK